MAGLTPTGFKLKRLADIVADATAQLSAIVDPVTGDALQPDFSGADPAMQVALVPLSQIADAWEAVQDAYDQFDPDKASESALAGLVQLNGLKRLDAAPSTATATLAGTPSATIPAGQVLSDVDGQYSWTTQAAVTLSLGGSGTSAIRCTVNGPVTRVPTRVVTPYPGFVSFTVGTISAGRNLETPAELRPRRARSTMAPAAGPVDALRANLANTTGVTYARVYVNNTLTTDGRGIPAKSVAPVVVGGADADIAAVLLSRTGVTSGWFGGSSLTLTDSNGEPYSPAWTRPSATDIYVDLNISITNPAAFPPDGIAQIKAAIVAYAQGGPAALGLVGFGSEGFGPGATVEYSRLYTPVNFVPGHKVNTLKVGTAPSPTGATDVAIAWNAYSWFTTGHINITVT